MYREGKREGERGGKEEKGSMESKEKRRKYRMTKGSFSISFRGCEVISKFPPGVRGRFQFPFGAAGRFLNLLSGPRARF